MFKSTTLYLCLIISLLTLPVFAQKVSNKYDLSQEQKAKINEKLNVLLANYSIFYQNARGLHWNIKGPHFFELHLKYEQLYSDALLKVDQIAERILALGGSPLVTYDEYAKVSTIKAMSGISDPVEGVKLVHNSLKNLMDAEKSVLKTATELGDEATASLMVDYIVLQEKDIWMYQAFLMQNKK